MRARHRGWLTALLAAALALLAFAWARPNAPSVSPDVAPVAPDVPTPSVPDAPALAPEPPPTPSGRASPPPVSAAAPASCPEDEPDPPGFVRPSVWELLRLRVQELNDRLPQVARSASPELRDGLRALHGDDALSAIDRLLGASDRLQEGFDVALAGLLHAGSRALSNDDLRTAQRLVDRGLREAPDDPLVHAWAALVHERADDPARARSAMARAHALLPDEPALALASARLEADAAHFDRALSAVDAYLAEHPEDVRIASWRRRIELRRTLTEGHSRRSVAGVDFSFSQAELTSARLDVVARALREALQEVARLMDRPRRAELAVVVYSSRDAMRRATCTPSWTGAVFDGVLHLDAELVTHEDAIWRRVIRHEATHAQLARVRGRIPTWLNEGLAQWMEGPPSPPARAAWARMARDRFWIPFASLEGELLVIDDPEDASLAYHQSLAMVLYMLDERGEGAVAQAVALLETGHAEDLLDRVLGRTVGGDVLLASLARRLAP